MNKSNANFMTQLTWTYTALQTMDSRTEYKMYWKRKKARGVRFGLETESCREIIFVANGGTEDCR